MNNGSFEDPPVAVGLSSPVFLPSGVPGSRPDEDDYGHPTQQTSEAPVSKRSATDRLSLVIPCYNEAAVLPLLISAVQKCLDKIGIPWEVICVDDGSKDNTFEQLVSINAQDPRYKVIRLSRNFGQQAAILAGLWHTSGQVIGIMDADLQDPPELLADGLAKLREGFDVVYFIRKKRKEGLVKRVCYAAFYRILNRVSEAEIPLDAGDFCLMTRNVVEAIKSMPEREVFLRGLRAWSGFRQVGLEYEREVRAAGEAKFGWRKLLSMAADAIFSFSILPLRVATCLGLLTLFSSAGIAVLLAVWRMYGFRLFGHAASELPGWTAFACGMLFFGGVQLVILGCIGEYIGRIYLEMKQRPRWILRDSVGFGRAQPGVQEVNPLAKVSRLACGL